MSNDPSDSTLPSGWIESHLVDVATLLNGRAYKRDELLSTGTYRVLRVGNFFSNDKWYWSDLELDANKYCEKGDLLYAWSASFGPRLWAGERVIFHYHIWKVLQNPERVNKHWLKYWFDFDVTRVKAAVGTGSIMMHVTKGDMEKRAIMVPPLDEQEKIVEILEEQLSRLDAALEAVRTVRVKAAQFRRSLLHAAFTGVLTGHDASFGTLPEGWSLTELKDLVEFSPKVPPEVLRDNQELSFVPMPKVAEVSGKVDGTAPISSSEGRRRNLTYFADGDVIFAKITPCMENGKIARPTGLLNGAAYGSTEFHVLRPSKRVSGEYLRYFLVHDDFRYDAERAMTGAVGQRRVPRRYLESYEMTCPPFAEQEKIVEILEEQLSRLDASLAVANIVEKRAAALRRSLLHAAFTGNLTKQWRENAHV